ncbi:MAG: HEPN domain-containing protein [Planctomycetota bacterium]
MKEPLDLARSWARKAESDLAAAQLAIQAGRALDAACFHAQQAAEKYLKAYLASRGTDFPFTHNLARLVDVCSQDAAEFNELLASAAELTPYAVELRYDDGFWPDTETAKSAYRSAIRIKTFVQERVPERGRSE